MARRMMTRWPLLLAVLAMLGGCDLNGLYRLGEKRDTLVPCIGNTSTYLRSTSVGTEILVLGSGTATEAFDPDFQRCFAYGLVEHDTSTHLENGSYWLGLDGDGEVRHQTEYDFEYEPNTPILQRSGSERTELAAIETRPLHIENDGTDILLTLDGTTMRFRPLGIVADAIDVTTQQGAEDAFRLVNLAIFTGNSRLIAFGGGGMTQYIGNTASFKGMITDLILGETEFTVSVQSLSQPNTTITYRQFQDLTGVVLDGVQRSLVNIGGNGDMDGTVAFVVTGAGGAIDVALRGGIVYDAVGISNGNASSGTFGLNLSGGGPTMNFTIPIAFANDLDLRRVLPELAP